MTLAVPGIRGGLLSAEEAGGFALARRADTLGVRTDSDAVSVLGVGNLARARADAGGGTLKPSVALGLRRHGGDAETRTGMEFGAGVGYGLPHNPEPSQQEQVLATPAHDEMYYYGDFYMLNDYPCRSTLEIVNSCVPANERSQLLSSRPEIIVVMMNPGTSRPSAGGNGHVRCPREVGSGANLVPTCPDDTQQAIVKVMRCKGFSHARVLNLSDVREVESSTFLDDLKHDRLPSGHSVFCSERTGELQERLMSRSGIAIAAWGKDRRLRKLAETALDSFRSRNLRVHGWKNHPFFIHPVRRSRQWPQWILSNWPS